MWTWQLQEELKAMLRCYEPQDSNNSWFRQFCVHYTSPVHSWVLNAFLSTCLTNCSSPPCRTATTELISSYPMIAGCAIHTWTWCTFIDIHLTVGTSPSGNTGTTELISSYPFTAYSPIHAWAGCTFVDIFLTVDTSPTSCAWTGVHVCSCPMAAYSPIDTRSGGTFVNINVAECSSPAYWARAGDGGTAGTNYAADTTVLAWVGSAWQCTIGLTRSTWTAA